MHYYKFNIGDYASHTRHLSLMEDLAYRRLLDVAYTSEKPLSKDTHALSRLIGMREYESEVNDVLREFFEEVEEGWIHGRVLKEIEEAGGRSDKAKVAAKARWECKRNANAMQPHSSSDATSINNNAPSIKNDATQDQLHTTQDPRPITQDQLPNTKKSKPLSPAKADAGKSPPDTELQNACKETWRKYCDAYFNRYGTEPIRNAGVNTMIKQFVQKIGYSDSPFVAEFFVQHNDRFYVQKTHAVSLMNKDAEGLRTQWATGRSMTATRAGQIDKTHANSNVVGEAMKILEGMNHAKNS